MSPRLTLGILIGLLISLLEPSGAGAAPSFTVDGVTILRNPLNPGVTTTIAASITNHGTAASAIVVDVEVHAGGNNLVERQYALGQSFAPGESRAFQWSWLVPANQWFGDVTVKIGVFSDDWAQLDVWNNSAATLTV